MVERNKYLEKFIDAGFSDLKEHLARIETKTDKRLDDMEDENTARHVDNQKRLNALEDEVGFVKGLVKLIVGAIGIVGTVIGIWKGVR